MAMTILIATLSIESVVLGHVLSRGVGVGISLFMAVWSAVLIGCLLGQALPEGRLTQEDRIAYANSIWFLWLVQLLIWTTIFFQADNDFGYVAKDNPFLVWIFPSVLACLTVVSIVNLIKGKHLTTRQTV